MEEAMEGAQTELARLDLASLSRCPPSPLEIIKGDQKGKICIKSEQRHRRGRGQGAWMGPH